MEALCSEQKMHTMRLFKINILQKNVHIFVASVIKNQKI